MCDSEISLHRQGQRAVDRANLHTVSQRYIFPIGPKSGRLNSLVGMIAGGCNQAHSGNPLQSDFSASPCT